MTTDTTPRTAHPMGGVQLTPPAVDGKRTRSTEAETGVAAPQTPGPRHNGRRGGTAFTRRRLVWGGLAVALSVLIGLSLRPAPLEVETGTVAHGPLETTVDAEGTTRVRDHYLVGAPIHGRLERLALREGDLVRADEVIARITPVPLDPQAMSQARARLAAAEAGRQEAGARVAQARAAREQAARTAARIRVVATAGGMSVDAVERTELQLTTATRDLQAAESRERAATAEVAAAQAALLDIDPVRSTGRATALIHAPAAGRVLRVHQRSERIVAAGTPLVELGDAASLEVVVNVLSTDAVRIQPGAPMRLVEWGGDGVLAARVHRVEPSGFTKVSALGVEEQRVNVIGELIAPPAALGDGYRVEARIVTWEASSVIKVPNSALFRTGDVWGVFVVEDGRARLRLVRIGHRGAAEAEVEDGLRSGEAVILFPSDRLQDGRRVRTV